MHWKDSVAAKLREHSHALQDDADHAVTSEATIELTELSRHAWDLAQGLDDCHAHESHAVCTGCRASTTFFNRCDCGFCPACMPRIAAERRDSIEFWTKEISQPKHVVLTFRNVPVLTKSYLRECKASLARLRRSKFARGWRGGFYSLEITNEGRGWHVHFHLLVDADWIDASMLAIQWDLSNRGQGYIVKVKDCREKSYLQEITKYAVKGSELAKWQPNEIFDFIQAFDGVRQFGVFGSLFGKRAEFKAYLASQEKVMCCEKCGCENIRVLDANEWEMFQAGLPLGPRKTWRHHT